MLDTANRDQRSTRVVMETDPGAAGKSEALSLSSEFIANGFDCRTRRVTADKLTRFSPFSAAAEQGLVKVLKGTWNDEWLKELENYTGPKNAAGKKYSGKDDQIDGTSGAFNELTEFMKVPDGFTMPINTKSNGFIIS